MFIQDLPLPAIYNQQLVTIVTAVEKDAGLLIVDSIASLARKEMMAGSSQANRARVNQVASWAAILKSIAAQHMSYNCEITCCPFCSVYLYYWSRRNRNQRE
ncbi:uncharacterized protein LOC134774576 [Penaeus indicus]|uniref:uncharacterized protein LOC134774576 n=1 Tax=Penaeus indicus TaxID=29960 RepID=UPI00300D888A